MENIIRKIEGMVIDDIQYGVGSIIYIGNKHIFFTFYCSWRIRQNNTVIINWHQNFDDRKKVDTKINLLLGLTVNKVSLNSMYDIVIELTDGFLIEVFTDISDNEYGLSVQDNWDFVLKEDNRCYIVDYLLNQRVEDYE